MFALVLSILYRLVKGAQMGDGFKHITVTAADDDEVIVAGVAENPLVEQDVESELAPARQPGSEPPSASASEPDRAHRAKSSRKPREDGYRETTVEDLEDSGMPFMQKVVIVAAIVCIIGALVYYFAAMR